MHEYAKTTYLLVWIRKPCHYRELPILLYTRRQKTTDTASAPTTATAAGAEIRVAGGSGGGKVQTFGGHPVPHPLYLNCPAISRACG